MRQARIETPLTGVNRTLGDEIDLVVAIEEWERLEFDVAAAAFRAGRAFGQQDGAWSFGAFLGVRVGF
jgi:ABC-type glycerol-3-phosphate transport system substrate-binding protein